RRDAREPLRIAAFGATMFVATLGPVLFLKAHVVSFYVGIAALGMSLTAIGVTRAVPRVGFPLARLLVAGLLAVHVWSTAALVRRSENFRGFGMSSDLAERWLYTLAARAADSEGTEVVLPDQSLTQRIFVRDEAHKVLLCARYDVRTAPPGTHVP